MDMIAQEMLSESQRIGILPKLVRKFVQRRQQVKKAMKDPTIGDSQRNQVLYTKHEK
jgi:DNA polymerase elongation subunit (family B)